MTVPLKRDVQELGGLPTGDGGDGRAEVSVRVLTNDGSSSGIVMLRLKAFLPMLKRLTVGQLQIALPDGQVLSIKGTKPGPHAEMRLRRWRVFRRAILRGDVGLGEAFMDGDWNSPDETKLLLYFAANTTDSGHQFTPRGLAGWILSVAHALRENSLRNAPRNIAAHYDLGNDFYAAWLDPSMTYSAALFQDQDIDIEVAQKAKYQALIKEVGIQSGDHVLEIGCGWGGFACEAARQTGCQVTAVTLSPTQRDYAAERVLETGLAGQVTILEQDYRAISGQFDHVVSIEMIEAVGERYWPVYFSKVASLLRTGGRFGLQAITIKDAAFPDYRKTSDFLQTYIFPGGMLLQEVGMHDVARAAGLQPKTTLAFGQDYARTLAVWRERFDVAWPQIADHKFDTRFQRMWQFYLAACEAGFLSGLIDVSQTVYNRDDAVPLAASA